MSRWIEKPGSLLLLGVLVLAGAACGTQVSAPTAAPPLPTVEPVASPTPAPTPVGGGSGRIAFSSYREGESELFTMNADGSDLVRLTDNVERLKQPAWSPDGQRIAYAGRMGSKNLEIFVMNADGTGQVRLTTSPNTLDSEPAWSPDGSKIAFTCDRGDEAGYDICTIGPDGSELTRLTIDVSFNVPYNTSPTWSPDGARIAFRSNRDGNNEIYVMRADGTGQRNLTRYPASDTDPAWSPDGSRIAFVSDREGQENIYVMAADGSNPTRLTASLGKDTYPAWSPDGQWIAFYSNRHNVLGSNYEIYVMRADGTEQTRVTTHPNFDGFPAWQPCATAALPRPDPSPAGPVVAPETVAWLRANAIPFSPHEGNYYSFSPLQEIVGDSRIVALGDVSYGMHEPFVVKLGMVEYLVKELGFSVVAMEVGLGDGYWIDHYIRTGEGNLEALLAGLDDWRWNTQEMLDLIRWMRAYNVLNYGGGSPVRFYGYGMLPPLSSMDLVISYLEQVDPAAAVQAEALYGCLRAFAGNWESYLILSGTTEDCGPEVQQVYEMLVDREDTYVAASSAEDYAFARQGARVVLQAEQVYYAANVPAQEHHMADNVTWIFQEAEPAARLVLWAHNFQVTETYYNYYGAFVRDTEQYPGMGAFLNQRHGDLVRIGFSFGEGQLNAIGFDDQGQPSPPATFYAPLPPPYTFAWYAGSTGWPAFLLPLNTVEVNDPAADWLNQPLLWRTLGVFYDEAAPEKYFLEYQLIDELDAMIYIDEVTPTELREGQ